MLLFIVRESGVGGEWPQDAVLIYFAAHRAVFRSRTGQMKRLDASTCGKRFQSGLALGEINAWIALHSGRLGEASGWSINLNELVDSAHTKSMLSFHSSLAVSPCSRSELQLTSRSNPIY